MAHEILFAVGRGALAACLALLVVLALRVPARRGFGAAFAYRLWLLVPIAMATAFLPAPTRPLLPALQMVAPLAAAIELRAAPVESAPLDWQAYLLAVWFAGAVALLMVFVRQQRHYLKSLGALDAHAGGALRAQATTGCPALVGLLRPRIVVPGDFDSRYTPAERELVLAHENTHLQRGDVWINALVALLRCLNWFNPLFHFAASRFRFDQEIACDAAVMSRFPEARRRYADAMLKAQQAGEPRQELRLPAGCLWPAGQSLKERITMLKFPVITPSRRRLAHTIAAALTFAVGYASWAAQPGAAPGSTVAGNKAPPSGDGQPATSIQLGELRNIAAPSEDISYRRMKPPAYPLDAIKAGVGAKVMLKIFVDAQGTAKSAEIEKLQLIGNPKPLPDGTMLDKATLEESFAQASKAAALSWKYNPGSFKDGKTAGGYALVPIDFSITDDDCTKKNPCPDHDKPAPAPAAKQGGRA